MIREVCNPREQQLLRLVANGKSPGAIAKLYREYEGENGVLEAIEEIKRRIAQRLAPVPPKPDLSHLEEQLERELSLEEQLSAMSGLPVEQVAAERQENMRRAGGAPVASDEAPPVATPPAPRPVPSPPRLARPRRSPATTTGGAKVPSQATIDQKKEREDKAVDFVTKHGPARALEISRASGIPSGSITGYMERLVDEGRVELVEEDGGKFYRVPGADSKPAQKPAAPQSPSPAEKAPDAGSAGSRENASHAPTDASLSNGNGVVDGLIAHLLTEGRDWTAEKTHRFVGHVRELAETLHAD